MVQNYPQMLLLIGLMATPLCTQAQDFYAAGISSETARRAGIFNSAPDNAADALSLNPAGLAALSGTVINASIIGMFARGSFSNASNSQSSMSPNYGFFPSLAMGIPVGRHWVIGVGMMPDLLSTSKWHYADTPGFAGTTYGRQTEKSEIIAVRGTAALAYRFSKWASIGVSFGEDYNSNTLDAPYIFQSHPVLAGLKTLLDLHTTGWGANSTVGVDLKPGKRFQLGASFRSSTSIYSHGNASGNMGLEFQSLGLAAQPDFRYSAGVHVILPPSVLVSTAWKATPNVKFSFQTDWLGWKGAFRTLPVTLTDGTNADINGLLNSTTIKDSIPLEWKDQITFRGAIERSFGERIVVSGGYSHGNDPVPNSTLSPLTAAIMENGLSSGISWIMGRIRFGASYRFNFTANQNVPNSALLYDEYSKATTKIGLQGVNLSAALRF